MTLDFCKFKRTVMKKSLESGDYEINWQKLETAGQLSERDHKIFHEETKNLIPYE